MSRVPSLSALLLLLCTQVTAVAFAPAPVFRPKKPAGSEAVRARMEGLWVVERYSVGGVVQGGPGQVWEEVRVERGVWSQGCTPAETGSCTWTTPYLVTVHANELTRIDMAYRPQDAPLLYGTLRIEGDRLTVTHATSGPVPTSHDAELLNGQVRWVLRRARP